MAYPASKPLLTEVLREAHAIVLDLRNSVLTLARLSSSVDMERRLFVDLAAQLEVGGRTLRRASDTPGIGAVARLQFADPELDVRAELLLVAREATALRDWMISSMPRDDEGKLIWRGQDGQKHHFAPRQLAGFREQAAAFMAAID